MRHTGCYRSLPFYASPLRVWVTSLLVAQTCRERDCTRLLFERGPMHIVSSVSRQQEKYIAGSGTYLPKGLKHTFGGHVSKTMRMLSVADDVLPS